MPASVQARVNLSIKQQAFTTTKGLSCVMNCSLLQLSLGLYLSHMHHLTCGISSLLHSVNLILFTLLLVHGILHISPHHSHHLRSHHLSLPLPFTPDLKFISFTNVHSHSFSSWTAFTILICTELKGHWRFFVLVSSFLYFLWLRVLDKAKYSASESTLNFSIVSYCKIIPLHYLWYVIFISKLQLSTFHRGVSNYFCLRFGSP